MLYQSPEKRQDVDLEIIITLKITEALQSKKTVGYGWGANHNRNAFFCGSSNCSSLLGRDGAMLQQLWIIGTGCQHHALFSQAKIVQLPW